MLWFRSEPQPTPLQVHATSAGSPAGGTTLEGSGNLRRWSLAEGTMPQEVNFLFSGFLLSLLPVC